MKVKVRAKLRLKDLEECIKEAALRAVVDEVTRISGDFVEELFHPGFWERLKNCIGPEADVEVFGGGKIIEKGTEDYFDFAERVLMLTVDKGLAQTLGRILNVRFHELSYNMSAEVENLEDFLEELKGTLNKTFEMCTEEELKRAWIERTKAVRTLLKVVEYGDSLVP